MATAVEAARNGIVCGIDISDGLMQDIGHVCAMSNVGAAIRSDDVPRSGHLREAYPDCALELACTGGEDYELLFVGSSEKISELRAKAAAPITVIGKITGEGRSAPVYSTQRVRR